jgi:glyoxylate reductase
VGWSERSGNPDSSGNVFVTQRIPEAGLDLLRKHCEIIDVNFEDRVLSKDELLRAVKGRDGVLCMLTDRVDAEVLEAARGVKGFANYAVGYDNIDVGRAAELGILVTNTPGVLTDATADLAWALMLTAARRIVEGDRLMRAGEFRGWAPMLLLGADITERTLGIVGAGRIGTAVALRSVGFRMKVLYCDTRRNEEIERAVGAKRVDLRVLLAESDLVSLHVALTPVEDHVSPKTHHLIGARELAMMKPTAVLVNTSRGAVVDEAALIEALRRRQIAAAGLDVYEDEPRMKLGLTELPNVVLAPHLGSATVATRTRMALMAAENLVAILEGRRPPNLVTP